ncbi:MAG: DMT family transporter [Candidatus Aenigmarchaeota archaeon]|nr:DMT family transporter [Candidatus Aenigmarchaeota archaeon]
MLWLIFSVLAALLFAASSMVDKYFMGRLVRNPMVPVMFSGIIGGAIGAAMLVSSGAPAMSYSGMFLSFVSAASFTLTLLFYFMAVKLEEISRISAVFYVSPIMVMVLASVFLNESLVPYAYLGVVLLAGGAMLMSFREKIGFRFGKAFWLIMAAAACTAVGVVITKHLLGSNDYTAVYSYTRLWGLAIVIPAVALNFKDLSGIFRPGLRKTLGAVSLSEGLTQAALFCAILASSLGMVTLTNAVGSIQPLFVLLFAVCLSIFHPKILREEIGRNMLLVKVAAVALIVAGAVLVS